MAKNIFTLQAEMDVLAYILASEIGRMSYMMPTIPKQERLLYEAIEVGTWARLDPVIKEAIEKEHVLEKAHVILLELGFNAWDLCNLTKKSKQFSAS